jgi:acetamidase/formamidase
MQPNISHTVYKVDPASEPCVRVMPGEIFRVNLQNAFGKSFESVSEFEEFMSPANEAEKQRLNHPCTGPIEIITNRSNSSLAVHILDLKASRGYQCISKSTGLLRSKFKKRECEIYEVAPDMTLPLHGQDLLIRGSPKLGFITTIGQEAQSCGRANQNGGNLDFNFLDNGSTIYLPVNNTKALLLLGDLHICQGNGEAAGIAIEADGEATLQVEVIDKIDFPVIDHKHSLVIVGWGKTLKAALQESVTNTMHYLERVFPFCTWSAGELYKFISTEGNLTIGNSTGKVKTCGTVFLKKRLTNKFLFPVF